LPQVCISNSRSLRRPEICRDPFRANTCVTAIYSPFHQITCCNSQNRPPSGTNNLLGTSWERRRLRQLAL
jgi:hypothetical protein